MPRVSHLRYLLASGISAPAQATGSHVQEIGQGFLVRSTNERPQGVPMRRLVVSAFAHPARQFKLRLGDFFMMRRTVLLIVERPGSARRLDRPRSCWVHDRGTFPRAPGVRTVRPGDEGPGTERGVAIGQDGSTPARCSWCQLPKKRGTPRPPSTLLLRGRLPAIDERPHLSAQLVDLPLLPLQFVEQHRGQDVVAHARRLAVLVAHHQLGVDLGHFFGD
jgi:hypothetical protein